MNLTEAIIVRISHDLAGAIGSFGNTLDVMKMDASFIGEGISLMEMGASQLTARLCFFRALYGAETKSITTQLVENYLKTLAAKIQFHGNVSCRLQLALIAAGLELVGTNATLKITKNTLTLAATDLHNNPLFFQALAGSNVPCDANLVPALWLHELAQQAGLSVHLNADDTSITISLLKS